MLEAQVLVILFLAAAPAAANGFLVVAGHCEWRTRYAIPKLIVGNAVAAPELGPLKRSAKPQNPHQVHPYINPDT